MTLHNTPIGHNSSLGTHLAAKSLEFSTRYEHIMLKLKKDVHNQILGIRKGFLWGAQHYENVAENVNSLLSDNLKVQMPAEEIFILLCATQFHGIGLFYENDGTALSASGVEIYSEQTYHYLRDHYAEWQLNIHEAALIRGVCLGLSQANFHSLPEVSVLHRAKIRVRFLAALLRLAIALDIDYTKVSQHILTLRRLSPASLEQWLRNTDITGILIDAEKWEITVYIAPQTIEGRQVLKEFIAEKVQSELSIVSENLTANGLFYRRVEIQLAHEEATRDVRVMNALQSYYKLTVPTQRTNPYKWLDFFSPSDQNIFFGRDGDIQRFLGYIKSERLVVLYGESGVGKTSLINAGLIPRLVSKGFIPIYTRCYEEPANAIKKELERLITTISPGLKLQSDLDLGPFFERLGKEGYEFVVFIDQFEEFFVNFPEVVRGEFIQELINFLAGQVHIRSTFVLALRKEYFVELGRYKSRLLELYNNAYELNKLTQDEVELAIEAPARQVGIYYDEELLKELVQDIYRKGDYNTPHIQIVCDKLVRSLDSDIAEKHLTLAFYNSLGRAPKILSEYLEAEVNKFPPDKQDQVKAILKEVVTSHGTKILSTPETIALRTGIVADEALNLLLDLTNRCRLLRRIEIEGQDVFELAHEHLVERVWKWLDKEEIEIKRIYEMLDQQLIARNRFGIRLTVDALAQVENRRDLLSLGANHKRLILESYLTNAPISRKKRFWIESLGSDLAIAPLLEALDTSSTVTYQEAVQELGWIGGTVLDDLIDALETPNWKIRQGVIDALHAVGLPAAEKLLEALGYESRRIRRGAVNVLAQLGKIIEKPLQEKTQVQDAKVRASAFDCLQMLEVYSNSG